MKKILYVFVFSLLLFIRLPGSAAWLDSNLLNSSSYTATNETTGIITNAWPGDVLRGVILSTESNVKLIIYDSSGAASSTLSTLYTGGSPVQSRYIPFNVRLSSGLTYTLTGNSQGLTIIYLKTYPHD